MADTTTEAPLKDAVASETTNGELTAKQLKKQAKKDAKKAKFDKKMESKKQESGEVLNWVAI